MAKTTHPFDGFTSEERLEIADQLGQVIVYFTEAAKVARSQRDHWKHRAERAETLVERYRRDSPTTTDLAVDRG